MDKIIKVMGRRFVSQPETNETGRSACYGCAGESGHALCLALPVSCGEEHVIYVEADEAPPPTVCPPPSGECDPNGLDPHAPGAKLDAGKVRPSLVIEGMARAIWAVAEVATFGARKYTDGGWIEVPNGQTRYADAQYRHLLKRAMGEKLDPDSELEHLKHEAWGAMAKLDLYLRAQEEDRE
jgi:hypothetical protein